MIIDVREPFEFATNHVKGAVNIPPDQLMIGAPQLKDIDKNTQLIVYCRSGSRSNSAIKILENLGFTNLVNGINQEHVEAKYLN